MSKHPTALAFSVLSVALWSATPGWVVGQQAGARTGLEVQVDSGTGNYSIASAPGQKVTLTANIAAEVDGKWVHGSDFPVHHVEEAETSGELGEAHVWKITHSGRRGAPDLVCSLLVYRDLPFGEVQVTARNQTDGIFHIESLRQIESIGPDVLTLNGSTTQERVLSDSFSEDRPAMRIRELADAEGAVHRGVGSQLIFNRQSGVGFFAGALTSDRFLTILRLHVSSSGGQTRADSFDVDSTGTTEMTRENSLHDSPDVDRVSLSLPIAKAEGLSSERVLFSLDTDYHRQLETYASLVGRLHHARTTAPTPMGWWSWTAYYFGLNQGSALSNAEWLSQHLKTLGYTYFHIDEGYQYARGEYSTPDAKLFPQGMAALEKRVIGMGLTPGIWTAPFEVSDRSWIYQHHPEWLIHNSQGSPIHAGRVTEGSSDQLYLIDPTHPGAQQYLRSTYQTLTRDWGIRYVKLDFMEDAAVEGSYYRPHTTALEAQRIGLGVIRDAVGDSVLLDKDGCELLNPVGYVDFGRISQDTGHTFDESRDAATGIAARYYMNRNYFVADPDAFAISTQTGDDQSWQGSGRPLTLEEARVSIALSAVSGGMFEIGDDLPTLASTPDRAALLENTDLIDMARLGHASRPVDLMTYSDEDKQPSIFLLHEDARQSVLSVFNWTEAARSHSFRLADLGLASGADYDVREILTGATEKLDGTSLRVTQPAHSVRMFRIVARSLPPADLHANIDLSQKAKAGETVKFEAKPASDEPLLGYRWDFGDGISLQGARQEHAYTHAGEYHGLLTLTGIGGSIATQAFSVTVTGSVSTKFVPAEKVRLSPAPE